MKFSFSKHNRKKCLFNIIPLELLTFVIENKYTEIFPNIYIGLRIYLTLPVTVASAERSFSKLKLIKTYLRSTMAQDRLNALAILSVENAEAETTDFTDLIEKWTLEGAIYKK